MEFCKKKLITQTRKNYLECKQPQELESWVAVVWADPQKALLCWQGWELMETIFLELVRKDWKIHDSLFLAHTITKTFNCFSEWNVSYTEEWVFNSDLAIVSVNSFGLFVWLICTIIAWTSSRCWATKSLSSSSLSCACWLSSFSIADCWRKARELKIRQKMYINTRIEFFQTESWFVFGNNTLGLFKHPSQCLPYCIV